MFQENILQDESKVWHNVNLFQEIRCCKEKKCWLKKKVTAQSLWAGSYLRPSDLNPMLCRVS